VETITAIANAVIVAITAPTSRLMPPLDTRAINRFAGFGGRYGGVGCRSTMTGTCRGVVRSPRDVFGVALAVLRQPVKTSATIASPAMTAARMVRSLTDTRNPTLMNEPPLPAPPPRPQQRSLRVARPWGVPFAVVAILVLVFIAALALLPAQLVADKRIEDADGNVTDVETPYALVPAAAQPVADRVSYGDLGDDISVDTDPDGRVYFVTVSEPAQSLLGYWVGVDEPEVEFSTYDEKYPGGQTPSEQREAALQMMFGSSQVAQYVALTRAGYDAQVIPGPAQVDSMLCLEADGRECVTWVPSEAVLQRGDVITDVDGEPISVADDISATIADREPGDSVEISFRRLDGQELTETIELVDAADILGNSPDDHRPIIGFAPFDTRTVQLPFEIQINTGEIGGPSAGLAFTLTLIDELTDGALLGGADVAVTGTIELDGDVGPIGGLPQKVSAVRQAGLDYFLVPAGQTDLEEAREIAGDDVELIPVANVDDALVALEELGGDPLSD
jgi:PDZ domain-containing protein